VVDGEFKLHVQMLVLMEQWLWDVNDKGVKLKLADDERMYHLLEHVGTKPNVIYHVKILSTKLLIKKQDKGLSSHYEATIRKPLVIGDKSYHDVTVDVAAPVEGKANKHWWIVFSIALTAFLWGIACIIHRINRNRNMGIK
jgi:hypothetical protein